MKDDIAERMGVVLQECLPSQCGAPEAWHYAQALAALGSRVLQEMHRAGSVGAMVTGLIAQAAMDLELAEWKDGRFYVRSRVHGDKPPVPEEELGEIEQAERKGAFARAAEEERGDRPPDPVDFSPAVSDAGIGP